MTMRIVAEKKSLIAPTFLDRELVDFQITSVDVDHVEMVHILD